MPKTPLLIKEFTGNIPRSMYRQCIGQPASSKGALAQRFQNSCAAVNNNIEQPQTNHKEADRPKSPRALNASYFSLWGANATSSKTKPPIPPKPSPRFITEKLKSFATLNTKPPIPPKPSPGLIANKLKSFATLNTKPPIPPKPSPGFITNKLKSFATLRTKPPIPPKPSTLASPGASLLQGKLMFTQKPSPMATMVQRFSTLAPNTTDISTSILSSTKPSVIFASAAQSKKEAPNFKLNLHALVESAFNTQPTSSTEQNNTCSTQQAANENAQKEPLVADQNKLSLFNRQITEKEKKAARVILNVLRAHKISKQAHHQRYNPDYKEQYTKMKEGKLKNNVGVSTLNLNYSNESLRVHFYNGKAIGYQSSLDQSPTVEEKGGSKILTHKNEHFVSLKIEDNSHKPKWQSATNHNTSEFFRSLPSFKPTYFIDEKHAIARNGGITLFDRMVEIEEKEEEEEEEAKLNPKASKPSQVSYIPLSAFECAMRDLKILHQRQVHFIDIKPENMTIRKNKIYFIDTDSAINIREPLTNMTNDYTTMSLACDEMAKLDLKEQDRYVNRTTMDAFASLLTMVEATENEFFDIHEPNGLRTFGLIGKTEPKAGASAQSESENFSEQDRIKHWIDKNVKPESRGQIMQLAISPASLTESVELYDAIDWDKARDENEKSKQSKSQSM